MTILLIISIIIIIILLSKNSSIKKERDNKEKEISSLNQELQKEKNGFSAYKESSEYLKKYEPIKDIEKELNRISREMEQIVENSNLEANTIKKEARQNANEIKNKAEIVLENAHNLATKIQDDANLKAEDIAGEAWKAKENAEQYQATVKAMRNIIKGYGDEYLIPNQTLLDDLAEKYNHKEAGNELLQIRGLIKSMIKNNEVAECDYVENYRKVTAIEFILDAFNGKVDSIMAKVKHDNYGKLLQSLEDAYRLVNHNGKAFRNARITDRYYNVILEQLKLAVTVHELKKQDLQEQREIRDAIREEEKARRDFEKARKEVEKEEKMLKKARKEIEEKLSQSLAEDRAKFEQELEEIKEKLLIAEEKGQRALSMAQQTKRGHVYIISNIGSFGENIFKIGLTRRLEPLDRVKELGDASVPFTFDIHAMIHSEDAPKLEKELHDTFNLDRVNKINYRKEFFSIPIIDIKAKMDTMDLDTHWTMKADALEFRESAEMKRRELSTLKN
jgi:septal ring factor EnvC (AmiA/AmiB activator)